MSLHRNKKEILATVEQSHYLPILGSLLIGFIIAWSVRQPGFHEQPTYDSHGAATLLARDLPVREADTLGEENKKPAHDFGEFQPLVAEKPEIKTIEWNSALPRPELFVKTTPTDGGHLISFSTNNFTIGNNGYLVLSNDVGEEVTKVYASPYFIKNDITGLTISLVDKTGAYITFQGEKVQEVIQ